MNPERVFEMVRKEFRQIFRDSRLRRMIFIAPVIQLLAFGYAVSTDVRNVSTLVVDHDRTRASRELVEAFRASGYFRIEGYADRPAEIVSALDHGTAVLGMVIPEGFERDASDAGEHGARVQLLFDGTNSNLATVARGYAERIVLSQGAQSRTSGIDLRSRAWFNPDLDSRDYNVPAVIGALLMLICLILTSLAVVREREIGTLEQLLVSPLRPGELILGKTLPFALIGTVELVLVVTIALTWFHIPFRGNPLLLLLASVLFLFTALGTGLLISTISNTQQEAFMSGFLVFLPSLLLSGFMFPVNSMPRVFQMLTLVIPLRHYLEIVRAVFLKGAGFEALWRQLLALLVMGVALLWAAARRFRGESG
ncbi:MAG TPA: ABC transporter permease [Thermoanaerobaculia bacterium]|jgi:ABC-2 type transport system permease protein|nr:ABC transporter permease [Thermoanaerobaculia bacterium]